MMEKLSEEQLDALVDLIRREMSPRPKERKKLWEKMKKDDFWPKLSERLYRKYSLVALDEVKRVVDEVEYSKHWMDTQPVDEFRHILLDKLDELR